MSVFKQALVAVAMGALVSAAQAAPVVYQFSTSSVITAGNSASPVAALLQGSTVSGQFSYNPQAPLLGGSGALGFAPGFAIYVGNNIGNLAFFGLSGHVGGRSFSDQVGSALVANDNPNPALRGDTLSLSADPAPQVGKNVGASTTRPLSGFQVGDYVLKNVRLFWTQADGSPAFLNSFALPSTLPSFQGHVALDFALASDPLNTANADYYANTVIFNGLTASAVPEPGAIALVGAGLLVLARRARKPSKAASQP